MSTWLREASGVVLLVSALWLMGYGVAELRGRDYVACIIVVLTGLSVMKAAVVLLRPASHD